jgi:hypothetical protein
MVEGGMIVDRTWREETTADEALGRGGVVSDS